MSAALPPSLAIVGGVMEVDMLFRKNLPGWERVVRAVAGVAMIAGGLLGPGLAGTPVGMIVAASGGVTILTGFFGYCPACALAGRRLPQSQDVR
jgi:hypothetical protein